MQHTIWGTKQYHTTLSLSVIKRHTCVCVCLCADCRYLEDFTARLGDFRSTSTRGAISVHINSNEHTDSRSAQNWIDFDAQW